MDSQLPFSRSSPARSPWPPRWLRRWRPASRCTSHAPLA